MQILSAKTLFLELKKSILMQRKLAEKEGYPDDELKASMKCIYKPPCP